MRPCLEISGTLSFTHLEWFTKLVNLYASLITALFLQEETAITLSGSFLLMVFVEKKSLAKMSVSEETIMETFSFRILTLTFLILLLVLLTLLVIVRLMLLKTLQQQIKEV